MTVYVPALVRGKLTGAPYSFTAESVNLPFSGSSFSPCRVTCAAKQSSAVRLKPGRHDHDVSAASTLRRVRVRVVKVWARSYQMEAKESSVAAREQNVWYCVPSANPSMRKSPSVS